MEYDDTETAVAAPLDYHRGVHHLIWHWKVSIPEFIAERKPARSCLYKHRRLIQSRLCYKNEIA